MNSVRAAPLNKRGWRRTRLVAMSKKAAGEHGANQVLSNKAMNQPKTFWQVVLF